MKIAEPRINVEISKRESAFTSGITEMRTRYITLNSTWASLVRRGQYTFGNIMMKLCQMSVLRTQIGRIYTRSV